MPISFEYDIIFVHIPRTGGHTIGRIINQDIEWTQRRDIGRHANLKKYKSIYPEEFPTYKKVTFVRNPWDRVYSAWQARYGFAQERPTHSLLKHYNRPFRSWVESYLPTVIERHDVWLLPQTHWYKKDFDWDFVGRYENFSNDIVRLCEVCKIPVQHLKRRKPFEYRPMYTNKMKDIVSKIYKEEIELFGYEF